MTNDPTLSWSLLNSLTFHLCIAIIALLIDPSLILILTLTYLLKLILQEHIDAIPLIVIFIFRPLDIRFKCLLMIMIVKFEKALYPD